jgi:hypothetical protein
MKNTLALHLTSTLALGALLMGCNPTATPSTDPGTLTVTISGLPAATNANVTVTGPAPFNTKTLTATQAFDKLADGKYTIAAVNVVVAGDDYAPTVNPATVDIKVGSKATATVTYAKVVKPLLFASYDATKPEIATVQGGAVSKIAYAGGATGADADAKAEDVVKTATFVSVKYVLSTAAGSTYRGAGISVNGKALSGTDLVPQDLSGYTKIRFGLSAVGTTKLQIKLRGTATVKDGCNSVAVVTVTPTLAPIELALTDLVFKPRDYCNGASYSAADRQTLTQTLSNVVAVEIEDHQDLDAGGRTVTMALGTVEFLK